MKLATKISAGYLILIGLMLSALVYQASIIFSLNSMSEKLSQVNFQAAHLVYQLKQDLSLIEEFTQKFFVTRDGAFRHRNEPTGRADLRRIWTGLEI